MKTALKATGIIVGILLVFSVIFYFTVSNNEIKMRAQTVAQQETNQAFFDKMWKIINQQAGVAEEYRESFKDVYNGIMEGRYQNARGGALMSWIQEHNPEFDSGLFKKIQQSIEAQRDAFFIEQKKLISYQTQHKIYLTTVPNKWFIGSRDTIAITIVKSEKTERVFETGKEELEPLFSRNKE